MEIQNQSFLRRLMLKFDKYGIPLNLTFNGKKTYQSSFGFTLTLIQFIILCVYLAFQIITVHSRSDIKIYSQESYLGNDFSRRGNISHENLGLRFRIQYYGPNVSWQGDEVYTLFSPVMTNDFLNGTTVNQEFDITPPDSNTFTTSNYPAASLGLWKGYGAIISSQQVLKGNLKIEIFECKQAQLDYMLPGKQCKTAEESIAAISGVQVYIEYFYQYFDSTNFTEPLNWKSSVEGFGLSQKFSHARTVMLREKYLRLRDNLLNSDYGEQKIKYFSVVPNIASAYYVNDITYKKRMLSFNVLLDDAVETTTREVRNYGQALSSVGGVLGLLSAINWALISFFVSSEMDVSLISSSFTERSIQPNSPKSDSIKQLLFGTHKKKLLTLLDSIILKLTVGCQCLRSRRLLQKNKIYEKATNILAKEISVQNLIQMSRMIKLLSKIILPSSLRVIAKQVIVKDLMNQSKTQKPKQKFLTDTQIQKLIDKKKYIYQRFFKKALGHIINDQGDIIDIEKRFAQKSKYKKESIQEFKLNDENQSQTNYKPHQSTQKLNIQTTVAQKKKVIRKQKKKKSFMNLLPDENSKDKLDLENSQRRLKL